MIHKAVRIFRQFHKMTQAHVAEVLGISKIDVIQMESGKKPIPQNLIEAYSELFDIPASTLVFFSESLGSKNKISEKFKGFIGNQLLDITEWISERGNEKQNKN